MSWRCSPQVLVNHVIKICSSVLMMWLQHFIHLPLEGGWGVQRGGSGMDTTLMVLQMQSAPRFLGFGEFASISSLNLMSLCILPSPTTAVIHQFAA